MLRRYHDPRTAISGAIGPLRHSGASGILKADGLGAARGQRSRKGPCASHPTRQNLPSTPSSQPSHSRRRTVPVALRIKLTMRPDRTVASAFRLARRTAKTIVCALCLSSLALLPPRAEVRSRERFSLREATIAAFGKYIVQTEAQNAKSLRQGPFLWIDGLPEKDRSATTLRLKNGEVESRRLGGESSGEKPDIPGGMIHDWEGIIFIPGVKIDEVLKILQDYNHQATYYAPDVEKARIESQNGDQFRVFLRFRRHKVVTVVLDTEHAVTYFRDSSARAHSRSSATRIAQVEDPDGPREKEKEPGEDDGYLWRMETWWRLEERDGGVYVQNQVVTLTRDIPTGLAWLIEPFVTKIPRETLDFTLEATRKAVLSQSKN